MADKINSEILLSAGFDTRMLPLTNSTLKPLVSVAGKSQISYTVDNFINAGVRNIIVNAYHLKEQVIDFFADYNNVHIIEEEEILETGGGVKNALDLLDDLFFVSNTDSILTNGTSLYPNQMEYAFDYTMDGLLLLIKKEDAIGYIGSGDYVFSGVQILRKSVFANTPDGAFSLNIIYDRLLSSNRLKGIVHGADWYHISTPEDVQKISLILKNEEINYG